VLGIIHDAKVIQHFKDLIKTKKIILADGHHRYEGSLAHLHNSKRSNRDHTGEEGYNFHMMFLSNTEAGDVRILPTHRLVHGIMGLDGASLLTRLEKYFTIKVVDDVFSLEEVISGKPATFGLIFKDAAYKIKLKEGYIDNVRWPFPTVVKKLDLTLMHYYILEKGIGIPGKEQRKSHHISFDRSFADCLDKVRTGESQLAIITNAVSIDDVKNVCASGYTMPQKSTYFFPKIITGFVFSSIKTSEFKGSPYAPF
jgi:uncharacterized protein (DUF1015 family)